MSGGLVVGKFCPLHLGHEHIVNYAASHCDELLVLSYTKPEFDGCLPDEREQWLAARFPGVRRVVLDDRRLAAICVEARVEVRTVPENNAPAAEQRLFVAWLCANILKFSPDTVFTSEEYGEGFAATLGAQLKRPVRHETVDVTRSAHPVSGTLIRSDVHTHRQYLHPDVYASFVRRACLLGGESTGKSTLAAGLARALKTTFTTEYGRELWERRGGALRSDDMLDIAREQVRREQEAARSAHRWVVCDTSPLTTLFYAREMFGQASPELEALSARPYEVVFLCAPDFPFMQDGTRRDASFRQRQHDWYMAELDQRKIPWSVLAGSLEERLLAAADVLRRSK